MSGLEQDHVNPLLHPYFQIMHTLKLSSLKGPGKMEVS